MVLFVCSFSLTEVYLLQYCRIGCTVIPPGLNMGSTSVIPALPEGL